MEDTLNPLQALELLVLACSKSTDDEIVNSIELADARQMLINNGIEL